MDSDDSIYDNSESNFSPKMDDDELHDEEVDLKSAAFVCFYIF